MMQQIFKGLKSSLGVAEELATYQKKADGVIGVINAKGHLTTFKETWVRPMASNSFEVLKEALKDSDFAIIKEECVFVDFPRLRYNLEWVRETIRKEKLGVLGSPEGLILFREKQSANQPAWYEKALWALKGVSVEDLEMNLEMKIASLSPTPENPDEANWAMLYFVA